MRAARTKSSRTWSMSARVISRGGRMPSRNAIGDGAIVSQAPSSSGSSFPSHISFVAPLEPEWPSCRHTLAGLQRCTRSVMRRHATACSGRYMPAQPSEIRASGETHAISVNTSPAPPSARAP